MTVKKEYPRCWVKAKLPDTVSLIMGQSPSSSNVNTEGNGLVFFQGKAEFGKLYPVAKKYCPMPKKIANKNDILLSVRAPVGPTNLANQKTAIGRGLAAISPYKDIEYKYLLYYFRSIEPWLSKQGTGSTFKAVSGKFLKELPIAVAPLAEQKQIVAKLDELLAQVDSIKARLDAIPVILKRFRQSVLAAAVSGRLTEDWRDNDVFGKSIIIGDIAQNIKYGTSKKCDYIAGSTSVLRIPNIGSGYLKYDDIKFADFDSKELKKLSLREGDLLIIRSNGSVDLVGKVAMVTAKDTHCLFAGYLIRIRLNVDRAHPKYVLYCLQSPQTRKDIEIQARSTSGVNNINSKELAALPLVLPDYDEQTKIVQRVEQLFAFAEQIEQRVKAAQTRVDHLTQSILAKAFRGELTAEWREQHPELISGENSAEALLARIKAEREKLVPQKRSRRKKAKKV